MGSIHLNGIDLTIFGLYMFVAVALGFLVSRKGRVSSKAYFLGGKTLPWYVVATSMLSADVSAEHFIANAGVGFTFGIVSATGSWNCWIIYSLFIFIFLPYYVRTGLYTVPQFLERRYGSILRYIFSASLLVSYVGAILAGSLCAGAIALNAMLGLPPIYGVLLFGAVTGAYTIYGGLKSAAWTDFMQIIVLGAGGVLVPLIGLHHVGGFSALVHQYPLKFQVFFPPTHPLFPTTGVFTGFLTVGLWYSCTSQHMVQRVLAAKDEYHARMGVVGAGLMHIVTPFFFVFPGVIAYALYPTLKPADSAYLTLVNNLVPSGLRGLILAAMAAALMSNLSSVLNSASTLATIDFYKRFFRPNATEKQQVRFGQLAGTILLILALGVAVYYAVHSEELLYKKVQRVFFFIAPPFAVIFTLGLLWRRATEKAALITVILGFIFSGYITFYAFPHYPLLQPYKIFQHPSFVAWLFCMTTMIVASLLTAPPPAEKVDGIVWSSRYANLPADLMQKYSGIRDWRIWWALFVGTILAIYGLLIWFRFQYPIPMTGANGGYLPWILVFGSLFVMVTITLALIRSANRKARLAQPEVIAQPNGN